MMMRRYAKKIALIGEDNRTLVNGLFAGANTRVK